jgi:hypothetical protein
VHQHFFLGPPAIVRLIEHLTSDAEIDGSNPAAVWHQEKMSEIKSLSKSPSFSTFPKLPAACTKLVRLSPPDTFTLV